MERIETRRNRRIEEEAKESENKRKILEQKMRNEKHWEMMRWITKFMKENKNSWELRKELEMKQRKREEEKEKWDKLTDLEKINQMKKEEPQNNMTSREEKIERAKEGRKRWKERREREDNREGKRKQR